MKNILFVFVVLFMFSCGDDAKNDVQKDSCDGITCESYETCDEGVCVLNSGSCKSDDDCIETNKTICDIDTHLCKEIEPECVINDDCIDGAKIFCENGICVEPKPECSTDNDCNTEKPVCDNGTCVKVESNCIGLSITGPEYYQNIYEGGGYYVSYEETIEEGLYFSLEFYEATPLGDYDLMSGINDNYETCMQCVLIYDLRAENEEDHLYFVHTTGTLKVTSGDAYLENSEGSISNIRLQEAVIDWDDTSHSTLVEGGSCYEVEFATWSN
jgi:hypothetical protein